MLKNAATKLAHSSTLPVLGNKELKPLQDLLVAEKAVLASLQRLSTDLNKASTTLKTWASNEGEELEDILGASSKLLDQFSSALYQYSSYQYAMREHMKAVRDREEAFEDLKRRRRALLTKSDTINRKLSKLGSANRFTKSDSLASQVELAARTQEQIDAMNEEIMHEEASLVDFKRRKARAWMEIKFGALLECCEKGSVACDFGKLVINEISDNPSQPGLPQLPYMKQARIQSLLEAALQRDKAVAFTSFSLESNSKEFSARSRANFVSPMYEDQTDDDSAGKIPPQTLHNLNESSTTDPNPTSDSVSTDDNVVDNTGSSDWLIVQTVDDTYDDPSHRQGTTIVSDATNPDVGRPSSRTDHITNPDPSTIDAAQETTPPTIVPPISTVVSSSEDISPVPPSGETSEQLPKAAGRNIHTGGTSTSRGGHFAAFPVKPRVATGTDKSVAPSTHDPVQIPESSRTDDPTARTNSAIHAGSDESVLDALKVVNEVDDIELASQNVGDEYNRTDRTSPDTDQPSSSPNPDSNSEKPEYTEDVSELDLPATPRPQLPSPRFSSHFTTKAYFDILSQRQAEEPSPPPLPPLPTSKSLPGQPKDSVPVESAPAKAGVEDAHIVEDTSTNGVSDSDTPVALSFQSSESPALPRTPPPSDMNPEPIPNSNLQQQPQPLLDILAPVPTVPNRVRFASNPVEIPTMRPRDSWDSLFTEDDEVPASYPRMELSSTSKSSSPGSLSTIAHPPHTKTHEKQSGSMGSAAEHNIIDLLDATTAKASSVLAKLEYNSPSISPSLSSTPTLSSSPPETLEDKMAGSPPGSLPVASPAKSSLVQDGSISATSLITPPNSAVTPPLNGMESASGNARIGNRLLTKKSLPSSPYPQRRMGRSPSVSVQASTDENLSNSTSNGVKATGTPLLSRSSSANATQTVRSG
ncbi:hypothetical protein F5878DRAFT_657609 [Lentinula raphanica]|uniref:Eisosome component PIL1-domain-containing protein n=1 Tax=Lentinula raphanica TaxID=153919 RepID=A0AA38PGD1_9AGAR|nr:hypothetical protein F5878DRAFT_657609 [Lentinula raphanica]